MANKKKNRKQQQQQRRQQRRQHMGNDVASLSRSASEEEATTGSENGGVGPQFNSSSLALSVTSSQNLLQFTNSATTDEHRAKIVEELSERFLRIQQHNNKSTSSSSLDAPPSSLAASSTASSPTKVLTSHDDDELPTTRTCSPTPSCCYSEEGQEVIATLAEHEDDDFYPLSGRGNDASSIDSTGANVGLSPSISPRNSSDNSLHRHFFEEKKDEDSGFLPSTDTADSAAEAGHHSSEDDDNSQEDDDHDNDDCAADEADSDLDLPGSGREKLSERLHETSPLSVSPSHRKGSSLLEGSADDSGFFTATQSDVTALRQPTSQGESDDANNDNHDDDRIASLSASHSVPHLEEVDDVMANHDEAPLDELLSTTPRTRNNHNNNTSDHSLNPHSGSSRGSASRNVRIRRRDDYDSVLANLQSSTTFASAKRRLDPDSSSSSNNSRSSHTSDIDGGAISTEFSDTNTSPYSKKSSVVLETTMDTVGTSTMTVPDDESDTEEDDLGHGEIKDRSSGDCESLKDPNELLQLTISLNGSQNDTVPRSSGVDGLSTSRHATNGDQEVPAIPVQDHTPIDNGDDHAVEASGASTTPKPNTLSTGVAMTVLGDNRGPQMTSKRQEGPVELNDPLSSQCSSLSVETNPRPATSEQPNESSAELGGGEVEAADATKEYGTNSTEPSSNNNNNTSLTSHEANDLSIPDLRVRPAFTSVKSSMSATTSESSEQGDNEPSTIQANSDADVTTQPSDKSNSSSLPSLISHHSPSVSHSDAETAAATTAVAAALRGELPKTDKYESPKVVKTILGSPTLAERKAALYTPRRSGKRDPAAVLQLAERPTPMFSPLVAIESEDDDEDCDVQDTSVVTPRQLDKTLIVGGCRSVTSCASRSLASEQDSPPNSPAPKKEIAVHRPKASSNGSGISLREGLRRIDSAPIGTVISKESGEGASVASLPTPYASSPIIFRTPLSISKRQPSDPKRMSDLIRLDLWSRDPTVVEDAMESLSQYATEDKNHGTIARTGGLLAIVRAMETHVNHPGIQVQACRCLEKLALDHDNELAIGEVGGIEAILGAMMSHSENPHVQEAAWAALWNLTCGNADHQMVVDAAGGIEVLVQCMMRHSEHPEVQKNACGTLANLCLDNEERLSALSDADGFVAISMALQKHWKNPDVRNEASYALTILLGPRAETYDVPVAHAQHR